MSPVKSVIRGYKKLDRSILLLITAYFGIQAVNTSFFLLLNYFMADKGFADHEVANVLSYRFLAVFWLAFPLGLFIKGRNLKPFFFIASFAVPVFSHLILWAIEHEATTLLNISAMMWGLAYTCMQVAILPYIVLNANKETHSEAISLTFLSFSVTILFTGVFHYVMNALMPEFFTEKTTLQVVSSLSFLSFFFIRLLPKEENRTEKIGVSEVLKKYDWGLILKVIMPTTLIAIGAGFTIPVINLFFLNVHGLPAEHFSIMGSATFLLVGLVIIFMPFIRRSFGYKVAITGFQSLSILALFLLATTEYYKDWEYAVYLAILFYVIRQPLMSAASPMTSELSLYYVGRRNQELISALNASIWSGSWFISMKLFAWLRQLDYRYSTIFLITVLMYILGVSWYVFLIRSYTERERKRKQDQQETKKKKEKLTL